ncbi:sugar phosphate isomerase/epimerase family protein [Paenibacillus sacheonensis]|uniref:TIM barrel protein n=1 Tax=Paenibacillus sacheonensis TaxID=742054 RepID=A0A7X4YTR7_9BACL|nr:sugar phosphate isomerase/epimerase family protein [Paenibacillus sacheonensis]MBM7568693.1 sugar phosphate isomerase/epimerase [Paenibacillus sacheonensis]NBC72416.1 TIM barrel protein [Paenibacillus sacheonensis]
MVRFGVSSYSLWNAIRSGQMNILQAIEWIADNGGEHMEVVPLDMKLEEDPTLVREIAAKAAEKGIALSNYAIGAEFAVGDDESFRKEIERVKRQVDVAHALGMKLMRHDVASVPPAEATLGRFMADFPRLVDACRQVADYADTLGIVTSVENHGYYVQASERVQALVEAVGRRNFRTTMDIGNFMCADENSVVAVQRSVRNASMIHLKDFYSRSERANPGEGWFRSAGGNYLRGAIVGQGDIDMYEVLRIIKSSGYDGFISIEFEGHEDCRYGTRVGLENAKRIWNEIGNV